MTSRNGRSTPAAPGAARAFRSVAVLVHEHTSLFELGVPCEVFGFDRTAQGLPSFDFAVCTPTPGVVRTDQGVDLVVPHGLERLADADLVVVVPATTDTVPSVPVIAALNDAVARGAQVISMCSAAFVLARAGLLTGRRATTHWLHTERLAREFPDVEVVPDVLYVEDGPIATSAGTAAGIDLCLHLVRTAYGTAVAGGLARRMVVPPHREGGQAQYVQTPVPATTAPTLSGVLEWARAHLDQELTVGRLAARASMSERTFARRFRDEIGTTPHHWVLAQRIALAEQLLEAGTASIDEVARRCGFGSGAMLRHHFARHRTTTPTAYRRTFAGPHPGRATSSAPRRDPSTDPAATR